ncbi:hypothetical protein HAX54_014327 [Datura stramonium]|uniref:PAR1 protein n=1 Tax=Datura stramonium TaxID=4076 RepID=A0ABS8TN06_DATST|nr:hypothetical protein [Datura stramonium]
MAVSIKYSSIVFFASALLLQGALGDFVCEELPTNVCGFAISTSGKRCLLENSAGKDGKVENQCKTSEVVVETMKDHIETDECINACGVDRNSVGISSDSLLEPRFAAKLCSPACYEHCANIIDLYYNLAVETREVDDNLFFENRVYLPDICDQQKNGAHRAVIELSSNGAAAEDVANAPAPYSPDV